jgi:uncharacterized protein (DUF2147 family)
MILRRQQGGRADMRGSARVVAFLGAALVVAATGARAGERLDGYWIDSHGEVILRISRCGRARCGKVAWLKKPRGPDYGPLRDFRNSDPKLKSRFVCGLNVVTGFKKQRDGTWGDGNVYVPDQGMSFSGYAEVLGPNHVKVSGYVLLPLFGSSEVWTRINRMPPSCEEQAKMIAAKQWSTDLSKWPLLSPESTGSLDTTDADVPAETEPSEPPMAAR